ncbi:MAG: flagellar basal body L-ring protein FlgH [Desulfobacterales bacterium]
MRTKLLFLLGISVMMMAGCGTVPQKKTINGSDVLQQEPISTFQAYQPPKASEGSLWSEERGVSLYPDTRARKAGDIVIVRIVEDPEAALSANTSSSRSSGIDASKLKVLGYMQALAESNSRLAQNPGTDDLMLASLGTSFTGRGSSDRNGHVKAYMSAVVEATLPNGNLYIRGRREIRVNHETQYITLSGIIRPEDISSSNEISSVYVANARIGYVGVGPVGDKQKPGWLGRVVDHVWPF